MRPDYSAQMLRLFLRARIVARSLFDGVSRDEARGLISRDVRRAARVTHAEFNLALVGRLHSPAKRAAIWGALGILPQHDLTREADL